MHTRSLVSACALAAATLSLVCPASGQTAASPEPAAPPATPAPPAPPAPLTPDAAYEPPAYITEAPELPEPDADARALSVQAAAQLAIEHNLGVALTRRRLDVAAHVTAQRRGVFEPLVTGDYRRVDSLSPPATAQEGEAGAVFDLVSDSWSAGVSHAFRSGTRVGVGFSGSRTASSFGTAVEPVVYRSELDVRITQPLLRGFSLDLAVPQAEVLFAELASERARHDVTIAVADAIVATEDAYWDLVGALKDYQVQRGSLELAREQMELTRRQIQAGVRAPAELISAEGTLAQRELGLVQAEAQIARAADRLRAVIGLPAEAWAQMLLPVDAPRFEPPSGGEADADAALRVATANRVELRQYALDLEQAALSERLAANARLPQLDVTLSYGVLGQDDSYKAALDQMASVDARVLSVSLSLQWAPLGRASRAGLEAARASRRVAELERDQRLLALRTEVREAHRGVRTAARQVRAAARFRALSEQSLDAEQRKFVNGTSDNFTVALRQEELARARQAELRAVIEHAKARTALDRATGTLLTRRGIRLAVAGKRRPAAAR